MEFGDVFTNASFSSVAHLFSYSDLRENTQQPLQLFLSTCIAEEFSEKAGLNICIFNSDVHFSFEIGYGFKPQF